jgi:ATP-dependent DNA ligase
LSFLGFEGEIPKGDYGAGQITVWDHGYYETGQWTDDLKPLPSTAIGFSVNSN